AGVAVPGADLDECDAARDDGNGHLGAQRCEAPEVPVSVATPAVSHARVRNPASESVARAERHEGKVPGHSRGTSVGAPVSGAELAGRGLAPALRHCARAAPART